MKIFQLMIFKRINIKRIALLIMLFFIFVTGFSQGTDIGSGKKGGFYVGFNVSPGQSTILNNGSLMITKPESKGGNSLAFAAEAGLMFSDYIGISSGIGFSSFQSDITLGTYNTDYDTTDNTEAYKRYITGEDISEIQKISFLNIPLMLNLQLPVNRSIGFFLQPGIMFSIPVKKSFSSSGTFTYEGYYSAYNVRITGVPYEGFEKDYPTNDGGELKIKSFNMALTVAGGIHYNLQENIQLGLGLSYNKLISDISEYSEVTNFRLSSKPGQLKSLMEGGSGATASSVGLRISVKILL